MVRRVVVVLILAAVLGTFGCDTSSSGPVSETSSISQADQDKLIKEASQAADVWIKLLDQGKCGEAWDQTGKMFKDSTVRDSWCKETGARRHAMGAVLSRTIEQAKYNNQIGQGPRGDYVTVHYDTSFAATPRGAEEVTLVRDQDGSWRPLGYYLSIRPKT